MANIDQLDILIKTQADSALRSLEKLVNMFDQMRVSVSGLAGVGGGLASTSAAIQRFIMATKGINNINKSDFTRLKNSINAIAGIDSAKIREASKTIDKFVTAFSSLNSIKIDKSFEQITNLVTAIKQLGFKSSTNAIDNIPKLANAMELLITKMSRLPEVSQNLINFTVALASLSRTGGAAGTAARSISSVVDSYSTHANRSTRSTFSLASAIGKLYATYWLLFRAFNVLKKAIDISSDLTEVQNVVDITFGKYSGLIDKMSETSITDYGMSELAVKTVASRFQAMGTAMGITQEQVAEASENMVKRGVTAYGDLGDSMANVSVNLTKLTADMASFYNLDHEEVAEDLQSIFTGQTRPLRQYGLDLTEATLKEWALKNGLDANINSMSQAEKTMLRYQYVMSQTGAAHGDFARTIGTWANQVKILKMNFVELGKIVGGTLINMFKPLVTALNFVMGKLIKFAKVVSESLGKIFGWEFKASGSGGLATDFEDIADSAGGIESGTGKAANNLGTAANNAKKLKDYMLGIDELNVISQDMGAGSDGGSGGLGSGSGGFADNSGSGGIWNKTDSIFDKYESELDTLFKLGEYIGESLTNAMSKIDWDKVYEKASNFGSGLAQFLNGLISPELFEETGSTIAHSLNAVIQSALSFSYDFEFGELGFSISSGISEFLSTFDFGNALLTAGETFNGLLDGLIGLLDGLEYQEIVDNLVDGIVKFVKEHDWNETISSIFGLISKTGLTINGINVANAQGFVDLVVELLKLGIEGARAWVVENGIEIGVKISDFKETLRTKIREAELWFKQRGDDIGTIKASIEDFESQVREKWEETKAYWADKDVLEEIQTTCENIKKEVSKEWDKVLEFWGVKESLSQIKTSYEDFRQNVQEKWNSVVAFWSSKDKLEQVKTTYESFKDKISALWNEALSWWNKYVKLPNLNIDFNLSVNSIKGAINKVISWINTHIIDEFNKISIKLPDWAVKAFNLKQNSFGFNIGHIAAFENGGYPQKADLFWANENGVPELVGTMGGRTAVASGVEITGISDAVYATGEKEASLLADAVMLLKEIAAKDMSVKIGDKDIARSNNRGQRAMGKRLITEF